MGKVRALGLMVFWGSGCFQGSEYREEEGFLELWAAYSAHVSRALVLSL